MTEYLSLQPPEIIQNVSVIEDLTQNPEPQEIPIVKKNVSDFQKHLIDCFLVGLIAALTTMTATRTLDLQTFFYIAIGGVLTAVIKLREYLIGQRGTTSMIFF